MLTVVLLTIYLTIGTMFGLLTFFMDLRSGDKFKELAFMALVSLVVTFLWPLFIIYGLCSDEG